MAAETDPLAEWVEDFIEEAEGGDMFCGGLPESVIEEAKAALAARKEGGE